MQKSIGGIFRDLEVSSKRVYIIHELKAGLSSDKFSTFWTLILEKYLSVIRFENDLYILYSRRVTKVYNFVEIDSLTFFF